MSPGQYCRIWVDGEVYGWVPTSCAVDASSTRSGAEDGWMMTKILGAPEYYLISITWSEYAEDGWMVAAAPCGLGLGFGQMQKMAGLW